MHLNLITNDFVPINVPQNMSGKITYRVNIKKEHTRIDGTNALYLSVYYNGDRKKLPLNISVPLAHFDSKKQRVKRINKHSTDYNLIIEKALATLNKIEVNFRLNNESISVDKIIQDYKNPTIRICFNAFALKYLEYQKEKNMLKHSTYRQQRATLLKIKAYKNPLLFSDINKNWAHEFRSYLRTKLKNKPATIEGTIKNFKKYLRAANDSGIKTELDYRDVKVKSMKGDFTFLMPSELKALYDFYKSPFINVTWKNILQRYLFSCFTGLRISDIEAINEGNFLEDHIVFNSIKTGKISRIRLNDTAKELINLPHVFNGSYSREHINRELKLIAKACSINKRIYYHSSRHTFGTNYLIAGGKVENLQKLMGHSKIETTMIYVHIVESMVDVEVNKMDQLLK